MSDNDHTEFGGLDQNEYDALAELFLGDSTFAPIRSEDQSHPAPPPEEQIESESDSPTPDQSMTPTRPASMGPAKIELAILGHLPVRAGLWLKEYAATLARECDGSVGLLRLAPDIASVDLIGTDGFEPHGQAPTFADAVRRARIDATRFLLRVNETAEPALAESNSVDRVTILTGVDEAALVASYRLVKSLAAAWDRQFDLDEGPELRLAIMGANEEKAKAAAVKLRSASESFLQRRIEILVCSSKIGASSGASTMHYRGEANESVSDLIGLIHPARGGAQAPATPPLDEASPDSGLRLVGTGEHEPREPSPAPMGESFLDEEPMPEIVIRRAAVQSASRKPEQHDAHIAPAPAAPAPLAPTGTSRESVASRVGLITLETVCPHVARVEFAAAADGTLHLVTESRGALDQAAGIERLVAAAAWARANLSLLIRAEPLLSIPSADRADDHGPILHVLIDDARAARLLLDTDVRVHLTRQIETGAESVWITDDLN